MEPTPPRLAHLAQPLRTPMGTYAPGTAVVVLGPSRTGLGIRLCLDDPERRHLGRCHVATVARDYLRATGGPARGLNTGRLRRVA